MRLIDADELKKHKVHSDEFAENVVSVCYIDWQPTIEAEPIKHAHVLTDEDGNIKCSNCGSSECWGNYCPNCGAKMGRMIE